MAEILRETFADFCKRQRENILLDTDEKKRENNFQEKLKEIHIKRYAHKRDLFIENLGLIMKHRDEIINTPRYAGIDAHYMIEGGGAYIGPCRTQRQINVEGTLVTFNLKLSSLLKIWGTEQFRVKCDCGNMGVITYFAGSPLSGCSVASGICPYCGKDFHNIRGRNFLRYAGIVQNALANDCQIVTRSLIQKYTEAEIECDKKNREGNWKNPMPMNFFHGDGEICSLETMIQELKLSDFKKS